MSSIDRLETPRNLLLVRGTDSSCPPCDFISKTARGNDHSLTVVTDHGEARRFVDIMRDQPGRLDGIWYDLCPKVDVNRTFSSIRDIRTESRDPKIPITLLVPNSEEEGWEIRARAAMVDMVAEHPKKISEVELLAQAGPVLREKRSSGRFPKCFITALRSSREGGFNCHIIGERNVPILYVGDNPDMFYFFQVALEDLTSGEKDTNISIKNKGTLETWNACHEDPNESLPAASSGVSLKGQVLSSVHPRSELRGISAQNRVRDFFSPYSAVIVDYDFNGRRREEKKSSKDILIPALDIMRTIKGYSDAAICLMTAAYNEEYILNDVREPHVIGRSTCDIVDLEKFLKYVPRLVVHRQLRYWEGLSSELESMFGKGAFRLNSAYKNSAVALDNRPVVNFVMPTVQPELALAF